MPKKSAKKKSAKKKRTKSALFPFPDDTLALLTKHSQSPLLASARRGHAKKGATAHRSRVMASKQTMMAPPKTTGVRPAAFLQTYAAKPVVRGVATIIPRSVSLQSKNQQQQKNKKCASSSTTAELRAAFRDLDLDGACARGSSRGKGRTRRGVCVFPRGRAGRGERRAHAPA